MATYEDDFPGWVLHYLNLIGRYGFAILVVGAMFLLNIIPLHIGNFDAIRPPFILMTVYYFSVFRPGFLPPIAVFLMGITLDLLIALPWGISAFILISAQWLVKIQRRFLSGQNFLIVWLGYILISAIAGIINWAIFCLLALKLIPLMPIFISIVIGSFLFPFVAILFHVTHKTLSSIPKHVTG